MISAKTDRTGKTGVNINGGNLLLLGELLAVVDSVTRAVFDDSEKGRVKFLKDLPDLILGMETKFTATKLTVSPEQLKKMIEEGEK